MRKIQANMMEDNIAQSILLFAFPILVSNIFQQLYNTCDTVIVGNVLGEASLAAIGACGAVYELLVGFGVGVGNGLSIVVARCYGANDETLLKRAVGGSFVIAIVLSLLIVGISVLGLYPLLQLLDTPFDILQESYSYISTITMFAMVTLLYNLFAGILRAIGNSIMPLVFLVFSSIVNIVLDVVFISYFNMGIQGAAYATVIAQALSAMLCALYIFKKAKILIPSLSHFQYESTLYQELLAQGFSMGFMMSIVSCGTVVLQRSINGFGTVIIAGHTTARKIFSFMMMPSSTIAMSFSTFVSQNKGANKKERIQQGYRIVNRMAIGWSILAVLLMAVYAKFLVRMVSGSEDVVLLANASRYIMIGTPFYAVLGVLLNSRNALQGLGEKLVPLFSSVIELIGKIIFAVVLIPHLGYFGVMICEPVIWCLMCCQLVFSIRHNQFLYPERA